MLILEQHREFYIGGGDLTGLFLRVYPEEECYHPRVLILSMDISRDTVVVEVADYSKPCPAVLVAMRTKKEDARISIHITTTVSRKMHRFHRVSKN
jgi:hypothetical protein